MPPKHSRSSAAKPTRARSARPAALRFNAGLGLNPNPPDDIDSSSAFSGGDGIPIDAARGSTSTGGDSTSLFSHGDGTTTSNNGDGAPIFQSSPDDIDSSSAFSGIGPKSFGSWGVCLPALQITIMTIV